MGPRPVREIENVWIPMSDGTRLAARLWIPEDAESRPVPGLLELTPYRKRERGTGGAFAFYASHGYAVMLADIRGTGDSGGLAQDEYVKQEQDDGVDLIAWIAAQPWCTGKVGMFGGSWTGFNALQIAARRPPALKAIITHVSTDDRYTDDAHYTGGAINEAMFVWGSQWQTYIQRPPDPAIAGPQWRDLWRQRLESAQFYMADWLSHPHRDEFWKHGSINEDYGAIECAVYAVGGWGDPYKAAVPRMLANLEAPRKGLIGPWGHGAPGGYPNPQIDWLHEALRWWDHWLKGVETGIMREPVLRVWMQEDALFSGIRDVAGRWVAEDQWPSPRIRGARFYLNESGLGQASQRPKAMTLSPLQTIGTSAPYWYLFSADEFPTDQREDDARSLAFDSARLTERIEILGAPVVHLEVSVDRPVAFVAVRLNEVTPDGISRRVTYQVLNLCHRDGHEHPTPLEPGKRYQVRVAMGDIAHAFKRGSRLRVAVSTTYWPMIWPSPEAVTLTLYAGASFIELPVRPDRAADAALAPFRPRFNPPSGGMTTLVRGGNRSVTTERVHGSDLLVMRMEEPYYRYRIDAIRTEGYGSASGRMEIRDHAPESAKLEMQRVVGFYRSDWDVRVETDIRFSSTRDTFLLEGEMRSFDDGKLFFSKRWHRPIARKLV